MKTPLFTRFTSLALGALIAAPLTAAFAAGDDAGFKSLFNGKDLTGWEGVPELWSVQDGAITGKTTKEVPAKENTFLVWKDGTVSDFELHAKFKLVPGDEK